MSHLDAQTVRGTHSAVGFFDMVLRWALIAIALLWQTYSQCPVSEWIDPDTPPEACERRVDLNGDEMELVFSDEFNVDGRTFQVWQTQDPNGIVGMWVPTIEAFWLGHLSHPTPSPHHPTCHSPPHVSNECSPNASIRTVFCRAPVIRHRVWVLKYRIDWAPDGVSNETLPCSGHVFYEGSVVRMRTCTPDPPPLRAATHFGRVHTA